MLRAGDPRAPAPRAGQHRPSALPGGGRRARPARARRDAFGHARAQPGALPGGPDLAGQGPGSSASWPGRTPPSSRPSGGAVLDGGMVPLVIGATGAPRRRGDRAAHVRGGAVGRVRRDPRRRARPHRGPTPSVPATPRRDRPARSIRGSRCCSARRSGTPRRSAGGARRRRRSPQPRSRSVRRAW